MNSRYARCAILASSCCTPNFLRDHPKQVATIRERRFASSVSYSQESSCLPNWEVRSGSLRWWRLEFVFIPRHHRAEVVVTRIQLARRQILRIRSGIRKHLVVRLKLRPRRGKFSVVWVYKPHRETPPVTAAVDLRKSLRFIYLL
jgi:hypothetical protein